MLVKGPVGAAMGFAMNVCLCLAVFFVSDRLVLTATGAVPIDKQEAPYLHSMARSLATWANVPSPRLYLVEVPEPNAFLIGGPGQRPAVVVTRGLLASFDHDEIKGVIAHELAHCKQGETLWSTYAAALLALAVRLRCVFLRSRARQHRASALGGLVAPLMHLSSARDHEYAADALSVRLTGAPDGLIKALSRATAASAAFDQTRLTLPLYVAHPFVMPPRFNRFNPRPLPEERMALLRRLA
ncbi:MAG TPA: M48 family metalloprotease [Symbiobacteriaceae bacterium]|nr:M48 family metalloprotease [Symbiobacteriaceae bacterium]